MRANEKISWGTSAQWVKLRCLAVALGLAAPANAQVAYQPGQAIQYSDGSDLKDAEFLRLTPDGNQAIVREKNAYSPGGYFERAVNLNRISTPAARSATGTVAQPPAASRAQARTQSVPKEPPPSQTGAAPRSGSYDVFSYGRGSNPLRLGRISLSGGGHYRFYNNGDEFMGEGQYSFATGTVTWRTGLLKNYGWGGSFKITRGGRDHSIRLNTVTYAINSS